MHSVLQRAVILSGVPSGRRRVGTQSKNPVERHLVANLEAMGLPRSPIGVSLRSALRLRVVFTFANDDTPFRMTAD